MSYTSFETNSYNQYNVQSTDNVILVTKHSPEGQDFMFFRSMRDVAGWFFYNYGEIFHDFIEEKYGNDIYNWDDEKTKQKIEEAFEEYFEKEKFYKYMRENEWDDHGFDIEEIPIFSFNFDDFNDAYLDFK